MRDLLDATLVRLDSAYFAVEDRLEQIANGIKEFYDQEVNRASRMEYLVTMTTRVPDGTPVVRVDDIRAREAARSRELAAEGHLLRLWRPPLAPGEWRTLGLFAASDDQELDELLASMPLRVWRTDDVTPLSPHLNDPKGQTAAVPPSTDRGTEFLTTFTTVVPPRTPADVVEGTYAREAQAAHDLAEEGHLVRLWELPGPGQVLGLWRAAGRPEMDGILESLPLTAWMTVETIPLSPHPTDPGA